MSDILLNFKIISVIFDRKSNLSLYKGSSGGLGKCRGLRFGDRSQFHVLLWIAFKKRLRLQSHQPFL